MIKTPPRELPTVAAELLSSLQREIDNEIDYPSRVNAAKAAWLSKTGTAAKLSTFNLIRDTLSRMCIGSVRCAYCEDSAADEIEHIRPKTLFPDRVFVWTNYIFACGPCNGPKSNRYGVVSGNNIHEFVRRRSDTIVPPPDGETALVDPRCEDPFDFFELDVGGVTADGLVIEGTFEFLPADGLSQVATARAIFSLEVLRLNRELLRVARQNAFTGFRARIREYVEEKENGAAAPKLRRLRSDLLSAPHLTVFGEMRRQRRLIPEVDNWLRRAPEIEEWPLASLPPLQLSLIKAHEHQVGTR